MDGMAVPATRYDSLISELAAAVPGGGAPAEFDTYLEKVRTRAYSITDEDVRTLKDAGYSEDEIFEYTVSAAVAAGIERLNAGLETLR
jgi:alkylhydroperoxidase family enzyme